MTGEPKRAMNILLQKFNACSPTVKRKLNIHLVSCIEDLSKKFEKDKKAFDSLSGEVGIHETLEWTNRACVSYTLCCLSISV